MNFIPCVSKLLLKCGKNVFWICFAIKLAARLPLYLFTKSAISKLNLLPK